MVFLRALWKYHSLAQTEEHTVCGAENRLRNTWQCFQPSICVILLPESKIIPVSIKISRSVLGLQVEGLYGDTILSKLYFLLFIPSKIEVGWE